MLAVRLWLHSRISMQTPSNVAVGYDQGVGATFFDLTELQVVPKSLHSIYIRLNASIVITSKVTKADKSSSHAGDMRP